MSKEAIKDLDVGQAQIDTWKEQHGAITLIELPCGEDDELTAQFYCKKPTRKTLNAVARYAADKQFAKVNELMINDCVIEGHKELLAEDDELYFGLVEAIGGLFKSKEAAVKKL